MAVVVGIAIREAFAERRRAYGERVAPRKERLVGGALQDLFLQAAERTRALAVNCRHVHAKEAHERVRRVFNTCRLPA